MLRQFGIIQRIPGSPLMPAHVSRLRTAAGYKVNFSYYAQILWDRALDHLLRDRADVVTRASDTVPGYMEWYRRVSHPIVMPPARRVSHEIHVPEFTDTRYEDLSVVSLLSAFLVSTLIIITIFYTSSKHININHITIIFAAGWTRSEYISAHF